MMNGHRQLGRMNARVDKIFDWTELDWMPILGSGDGEEWANSFIHEPGGRQVVRLLFVLSQTCLATK